MNETRRPVIAGNWKMNGTRSEAEKLVHGICEQLPAGRERTDVVLCPPFTALETVARAAGSVTGLLLGAQDCFWANSGAFTGEVSPTMLLDLGVSFVIVGHSERRGRFGVPDASSAPVIGAVLGETNEAVNRKMRAALDAQLTPILCVGETLAERRDGNTDAVVASQLTACLDGLGPATIARCVIAYEPVWAIGTGEVCGSQEANRVCAHARACVEHLADPAAASTVRILYGGSAKAGNADQLLTEPAIDGLLVGGASLVASEFASIVSSALRIAG